MSTDLALVVGRWSLERSIAPMRHQHACRVVAAELFAAVCGAIECQPAARVAVRETGLMWANMLRAFQVGKALTSGWVMVWGDNCS